MNFQSVSVLIVDDAKFTCEIIRRSLKNAGYKDIRVCNNSNDALKMLQQRRADVLLADWMMPDMDGLDLTEHVRQIDEENAHYTYIILLTAKDGLSSLTEAFERGVDDFINKSPNNKEIIARVLAGSRISNLQNTLLHTAHHLTEKNNALEQQNAFDLITGLGNRYYLEKHLENVLLHTKNRGGGVCCGLIRIANIEKIKIEFGNTALNEILIGVGTRLKQNIRPLDIIGTIEKGEYAIIMQQPDISQCHAISFKRIHQAINLRTFKTSAGYISISAAVSVCPVDSTQNTLVPTDIINHVHNQMKYAENFGRVYEITMAS